VTLLFELSSLPARVFFFFFFFLSGGRASRTADSAAAAVAAASGTSHGQAGGQMKTVVTQPATTTITITPVRQMCTKTPPLIHKGIGPKSRRVGRHLRYKPDEVRAWLEEQV
jgi:hypothetical protein